jgi:hypothetical protein
LRSHAIPLPPEPGYQIIDAVGRQVHTKSLHGKAVPKLYLPRPKQERGHLIMPEDFLDTYQ